MIVGSTARSKAAVGGCAPFLGASVLEGGEPDFPRDVEEPAPTTRRAASAPAPMADVATDATTAKATTQELGVFKRCIAGIFLFPRGSCRMACNEPKQARLHRWAFVSCARGTARMSRNSKSVAGLQGSLPQRLAFERRPRCSWVALSRRSWVNRPMNHLRPTLLILAVLTPLGTWLQGAESSTAAPASSHASSERPKVDINTADIPALEAIPEIGTDLANAVVGARPFKSLDEFQRLLKISPDKMKSLRAKVTLSPPRPPVTASQTPTPDNLKKGVTKPSSVNDGKAIHRKEVDQRHDAAEHKAAKSESKK